MLVFEDTFALVCFNSSPQICSSQFIYLLIQISVLFISFSHFHFISFLWWSLFSFLAIIILFRHFNYSLIDPFFFIYRSLPLSQSMFLLSEWPEYPHMLLMYRRKFLSSWLLLNSRNFSESTYWYYPKFWVLYPDFGLFWAPSPSKCSLHQCDLGPSWRSYSHLYDFMIYYGIYLLFIHHFFFWKNNGIFVIYSID